MKKNYLKPKTESAVVNMEWAMCNQPVTVGDNNQPGQGSTPNHKTAPKKVF